MMPLLFVVAFVAMYYLRSWIHNRSSHHPEWQIFDALDRMMQWAIVVTIAWVVVGLAFRTIETAEIIHEVSTMEIESFP